MHILVKSSYGDHIEYDSFDRAFHESHNSTELYAPEIAISLKSLKAQKNYHAFREGGSGIEEVFVVPLDKALGDTTGICKVWGCFRNPFSEIVCGAIPKSLAKFNGSLEAISDELRFRSEWDGPYVYSDFEIITSDTAFYVLEYLKKVQSWSSEAEWESTFGFYSSIDKALASVKGPSPRKFDVLDSFCRIKKGKLDSLLDNTATVWDQRIDDPNYPMTLYKQRIEAERQFNKKLPDYPDDDFWSDEIIFEGPR